jgi:hypothetical protein
MPTFTISAETLQTLAAEFISKSRSSWYSIMKTREGFVADDIIENKFKFFTTVPVDVYFFITENNEIHIDAAIVKSVDYSADIVIDHKKSILLGVFHTSAGKKIRYAVVEQNILC